MLARTALTVSALLFPLLTAAAEPLSLRVAEAHQEFDAQTSEPLVWIKLTPDSAGDFARITSENVGRALALSIDGKVVASPVIREPILAGSVQISGSLDADRATDLAVLLRDGKATIEVEVAR